MSVSVYAWRKLQQTAAYKYQLGAVGGAARGFGLRRGFVL